jgi:hypothetical protein
MTTQTAVIYLHFLINLFPGKNIGLIWDKHSSHYCDEVVKFIDENNNNNKIKATITLGIVDEGLTPIIQVPDVAVNKIFKQNLKKKYYSYRAELDIEIGKKIKVSKEKIVEMILGSIAEINDCSSKELLIQDAFKYCGLNPWSTENSLRAFKEHLDGLEKNNTLKAMILDNQEALRLE